MLVPALHNFIPNGMQLYNWYESGYCMREIDINYTQVKGVIQSTTMCSAGLDRGNHAGAGAFSL